MPIFEFSGGALALDFTNSKEKRPLPDAVELLRGYCDLVAWASQAGIIDRHATEQLSTLAQRRKGHAQGVLRRAVRLREAIFGVFSALAGGRDVARLDLDVLQQEAFAACRHAKLVHVSGRFQWKFEAPGEVLDSLLWPVAKNAVDLLADEEMLSQVRECASDRCAWLFLDRSRNRSRRWCDMKICGNRAKSLRHYRRTRQANAGPAPA